MSDDLKKKLREEAKEGKIACKRAFELAAATGCPLAEVGKAANEEGIKIVACQLGCF